MQNTPRNIEEKPYNACLDCANLGKTCDGPNFLAMTIERWVEWCRLRKAYLGMTNHQLAELSGVAEPSIERILSGKTKDPMLSTVQRITKALVNGSWGQYPCADPAGLSAELAAECQRLEGELATMTEKKDHFKQLSEERLQMIRDAQINMQDRKTFLLRKDKAIAVLSIALGFMTLLAIVALGSDAVLPLLSFVP